MIFLFKLGSLYKNQGKEYLGMVANLCVFIKYTRLGD